MQLTKILSGIAAILLVGSALNAETVTVNKTQTVNDVYADISVAKFNTGLYGTLTGVSVNVVYSTLEGGTTITNNTASEATVTGYDSTFSIKQKATNTLGYTAHSANIMDVHTTPDWNTEIIAAYGSMLFTIDSNQNFLTDYSQNISAAFFNAYQSVDGSGFVFFQAKETNAISATGGNFSVTGTPGAKTQIQITYTYDPGPVPVPEASTVIVQLLIVAGGVWMFVRRRRAAAVRA